MDNTLEELRERIKGLVDEIFNYKTLQFGYKFLLALHKKSSY